MNIEYKMKKNRILVSVLEVTPKVLANFEQAKIGIELSALSHPKNLEGKKLYVLAKYYKKLLKNFKQPISMHGAFYDLMPTARDPMVREVATFRVKQSLEIANDLGIDKVVFHANYYPSTKTNFKPIWIEQQVRFWSPLIPLLEKYGVTAFIENTREPDASYISEILTKLNHSQFQTCYDTGHSHCFTTTKISPVHWVNHYKTQLGYIHLHSNNGKQDEHIAFTDGTVDFTGFFEAVDALPNLPDIIIEVKSREAFMKSLAALRTLGY